MRLSLVARTTFAAMTLLFACGVVTSAEPVPCDANMCCDDDSGFACDPCKPIWTATADALFLHRSEPQSEILAFNTLDNTEMLNAEDFDFDTQAGVDLSLSRAIGTRGGLEIRYFGVNDWNSAQSVVTTPNELLQFNSSPPVFPTSGDGIVANYASKLHNAEINASRQYCDWVKLSAGFRYLELNERMFAELTNAAIPFDYAETTSNHLYGAQLGIDGMMWRRDSLGFSVVGKAGIFGNHSAHNAAVNTGVATLTASGSDDRTAFVGELGFIGNAKLTECLAVRAGYRLLWIDGVAVATDQLGATDFNTGVGFDGSGDVFYHGAFVGIELKH